MSYSPRFIYLFNKKQWEKMHCIKSFTKPPITEEKLWNLEEDEFIQVNEEIYRYLKKRYPADYNTCKVHDSICPNCFKKFQQPYFAINCPFPYIKHGKKFEWRFDEPSDTLNLEKLWKQLHGLGDVEKKEYMQMLKFYAPIVFKRYVDFIQTIKVCSSCKGYGGETEYTETDGTFGIARMDVPGAWIPNWKKCSECKGIGFIKKAREG